MSGLQKNDRTNQLIKNTFILAIGTFLPKLAAFVTLPILTGYLTKAEYGTYDFVTILVSLLLPTVTCQIKISAFRYLIDVRDNPKRQASIITNIFVFTFIISITVLAIMFLVLYKISIESRIWIALYYLFDIIVNTLRQIARGIGCSKNYSISAIISAFGKIIFTILLVKVFSFSIVGAIASLCLGSALSFLYLFVSIRVYRFFDLRLLDKKCLKELLEYSWPLVPNELSLWIMTVSDRAIVVFFIGAAANAVYSIANKIPSIVSLAQTAITLAWQENASIVSKDSDAKEYYTKMFRVMYNFQAGFMGLVVAMTPILFKIFIRGDYSDSYPHIPILCLAIFYSSIATNLGGIYVAFKATKSIGITTVVAAAINVIVNVSLIKFIGIYAASISTLVAFFVLMIYRMKNVKKLVDIKYNYFSIIIVNLIIISICIIGSFNKLYLNLINFIFTSVAFIVLNKETIHVVLMKIKTHFAHKE